MTKIACPKMSFIQRFHCIEGEVGGCVTLYVHKIWSVGIHLMYGSGLTMGIR